MEDYPILTELKIHKNLPSIIYKKIYDYFDKNLINLLALDEDNFRKEHDSYHLDFKKKKWITKLELVIQFHNFLSNKIEKICLKIDNKSVVFEIPPLMYYYHVETKWPQREREGQFILFHNTIETEDTFNMFTKLDNIFTTQIVNYKSMVKTGKSDYLTIKWIYGNSKTAPNDISIENLKDRKTYKCRFVIKIICNKVRDDNMYPSIHILYAKFEENLKKNEDFIFNFEIFEKY